MYIGEILIGIKLGSIGFTKLEKTYKTPHNEYIIFL